MIKNMETGNSMDSIKVNQEEQGIKKIPILKIRKIRPSVPGSVDRKVETPDKNETTPVKKAITPVKKAITPVKTDDEEKWIDDLRSFIYKTLSKILPNKDLLDKATDEDNTIIWAKSFTHESFDGNFNYEQLEIMGDGVLKCAFTQYIFSVQPDVTPKAVTELNNYYMSSRYQPILSNKCGFGPYVRLKETGMKGKVLEDIFESFFGALFTVFDRIKPGLGYITSYKFLSYIFEDIDLDMSKAENAKSFVIQAFAQLKLEPAIGEYMPETQSFILRYPQRMVDFFRSKGIRIDDGELLGYGTGTSKRSAEASAYENATENLYKKGVTPDWIRETKESIVFYSRDFQPDGGKVKEKSLTEGYKFIEFHTPKSTTSINGFLVQLIGVTSAGKKKVLSEGNEEDMLNAQKVALKKYLEK